MATMQSLWDSAGPYEICLIFFQIQFSFFTKNFFFSPFQFIGILFLFLTCLLVFTFPPDAQVVPCISDPLGMVSANKDILISPEKNNLLFKFFLKEDILCLSTDSFFGPIL